MFKSFLKSAAVPLALLALTVPAHAADPAMGGPGAANSEAALMEMFSKLFDTGDKTPIDPAQLALGQATAARLLPDGAYGKMMNDMIASFIKPMLQLDENMTGNQISMKTGIEFEKANALTDEQRGAVMAILDPGRKARNEGMFTLMTPLFIEIGKTLEGPMRDGLARAYARKFTPEQLTTVNAFFATPAGSAFAAESFAIQGDPEVLSATFQAIPVMMTKLMGGAGDFEKQMNALPQERKLAELSNAELAQLAKLLDLGDIVEPVLQRVVAETGETAAFHVREDDVRISLYRVESPQRIRDHVRQGEHLPLSHGAGGKVLLAFSGAQGAEFDLIRKNMIHVSLGDRIADLGGISAPVFGVGQKLIGALTVSVPLSRFDQAAAARFRPVVLRHAMVLTRALGGKTYVYPDDPRPPVSGA